VSDLTRLVVFPWSPHYSYSFRKSTSCRSVSERPRKATSKSRSRGAVWEYSRHTCDRLSEKG